ncbi:hypothetical protein [Neolewinella persica]|uniref:hypothetical protein n=1 Tax=Neolewinella persica TaxID=70998 RepID=UPI000371BA7C|nr:hypothetical protein [Neolewinella persica]
MSTDKLEDFILNNRAAFDDETPGEDLWSKIESAIDSSGNGKDPLETFIAKNRNAFDDSTPPPRIEGLVFAAMDGDEVRQVSGATPMPPLRAILGGRGRRMRVLGVAAAMLLLIAAAFTIGTQNGYRSAEEDQMAAELRQISPELAETENYYRGEIATQATKVKLVSNDPQLQKDLAEIDEATEEIRASLLEVPVSQRAVLIDRLIETYRTKLDILLRIQQHLPSNDSTSTTTQQTTNDS